MVCSGGVMAVIYSIIGFIAFYQDKLDISAFSFVVVGGILSFLWFNIPPAKFYMTEIGYNALSFTLVIITFMTDTVLLLPIIAFPLFITLISTILQVFSVRLFKKRLFKIAPLHHHFEAIG
ncbi:Phospho-N-acetylmuramoyl-pentapeptide- transferase [sediment metagenome]|uniref:Phospho-N-acetylmuramoyl-pentapeptide-transferase n=1 Tax=sediment metagenome TaxID=749907 RepID=D9PGA7_9ZZZZ